MKIFRLFHKVDGYKVINIKGTKLEEAFINFGNDVDFSKYEGEQFAWYGEKTDKDCVFPFINGSTPVFREDAYNLIAALVSQYSNVVNIKVGENNFKIIDALVLSGVLNKERSTIKNFKDGRIMNIKKYVFNHDSNIPSIFRISELKTFTFVTEDIINALTAEGKLEGLDYVECDVI